MSELDTRSRAIINTAEKAVANIQNPSQRAEAKARLDATLKKLEAASGRSSGSSRYSSGRVRALGRDQDFDR